MPGGYNEIYGSLVPKLLQCNFKEHAERLGLIFESDAVYVSFLNRNYRITKKGAEVLDDQPNHVNNKSVLLYYFLSQGSGNPKYSFVPLHRLTGTIDGRNDLGGKMMTDSLIRTFGKDLNLLKRVTQKLGGKYDERSCKGKHIWQFDLLPKIPAQLIFYEDDGEFPVEIQVLLDEYAPRFMEFECLAFLTGCFTQSLVNEAEIID